MMTTMFSPSNGMISQKEFLKIISETDLPIAINNKRISYYNVPAAFDIEVSSFYNGEEKCACMYVWQFGILNWVTYGRTWEEYIKFISVLSTILGLKEDMRLMVYIHNFSYEFQFMRKRFNWDKIFFLDERKPVYAITGGIEYRCSLKLSSKSLAKVGEDLQKYKVNKKTGDLDYYLVRTPTTELTETELGYCEADIRVLLAYIQEKIEADGSIIYIPLTNTGYVRNYCRKECFKEYKSYMGLMAELTLTPEEYSQLKRGFAGGFTHASANYSGEVLTNVASFDFTSSYPSVMLSEKFPMSKAKIIENISDYSQLQYYLNNYCCLMDIEFEYIIPAIGYEHPISQSKLIKCKNATLDNGRIISADLITLTCTEQDFQIYSKFYDWEKMTIKRFLIYDKAYLPTSLVKAILKLYKDKTQLKDVEGEELNYMISKNMLNAAYGMSVTDIVRDSLGYVENEYTKEKPDLKEEIDKYNKSKSRFLFYPWGVWVTAYARRNLFSGIYACGEDYVYSDTDSIKILNPENHMDYIKKYNDLINRKLEKAAKFHHIDASEFRPKNKKGKEKPIGIWDYEGKYDYFKTIGAKRYLIQSGDMCRLIITPDGKRFVFPRVESYKLTVAGVNKEKARNYLVERYNDPFEALHESLCVPSEYSGRLMLTYIDTPQRGSIVDYNGQEGEYNELSSVHMEPKEYTLTQSDEYKAYLKKLFMIKEWSW